MGVYGLAYLGAQRTNLGVQSISTQIDLSTRMLMFGGVV